MTGKPLSTDQFIEKWCGDLEHFAPETYKRGIRKKMKADLEEMLREARENIDIKKWVADVNRLKDMGLWH